MTLEDWFELLSALDNELQTDENLLGVFADWLEERGDPRAEYVRLCKFPFCAVAYLQMELEAAKFYEQVLKGGIGWNMPFAIPEIFSKQQQLKIITTNHTNIQ